MSQERPLSDNEVAELEQQQEYLLASLDDLDAEFEAGDMSEDDFAALADDYTRRAANNARAIEAGRAAVAAPKAETPSAGRQRAFTIAGVVVVAVLAGFLLARSVGFRGSNATATGGVRASTRTISLEAQELAAEGDFDGAIARYDEALEIQPSNAEALAYRAWFQYLSDDSDTTEAEVEELLDRAIRSEPTYADARVFRAVVLTNLDRFEEATIDLEAFDQSNPPPQMVELVDGQGLRERALAGLIRAADPDIELSLDDFNASAETMARAGDLVLGDGTGDAGLALRAYGAALAGDPDNITARLGRGDLLIRTAQAMAGSDPATSADIMLNGVNSIEQVIALDPSNFRAGALLLQVALIQGDRSAFDAELERLNQLTLTDDEKRIVDALAAAGG